MIRSPGLTASGSHPRLARRGLRPGSSPNIRLRILILPRVLTRGFSPCQAFACARSGRAVRHAALR